MKYRKIKNHPEVSLPIDTRGEKVRENAQALTLSGTCTILGSDKEVDNVKDSFKRHHSHLRDWIRKRGVAFLYVKFDSFSRYPQSPSDERSAGHSICCWNHYKPPKVTPISEKMGIWTLALSNYSNCSNMSLGLCA